MQAVLEKVRTTAERNHCGLLVLIIPAPTDLCAECGYGTIDSVRFPGYHRSALSDAMQEVAIRTRVPYVNLFTPIWTTRAKRLYFHGGDGHWNDSGQALAAHMVGRYIIDQALLQSR